MVQLIENKLIELKRIPIIVEYDTYYDVKFKSFGFDNFNDKEKDVIRDICGKHLMEFYYGGGIQHIYVRKNIKEERLKKMNNICQKYS